MADFRPPDLLYVLPECLEGVAGLLYPFDLQGYAAVAVEADYVKYPMGAC